ncbi:MAG: cell division protein ZapA [Phocaeicola sp.]
MDDSFKVHLLIDNERYPLTIKRSEEEYYRNAAKQINDKLTKYRSRFPNFMLEKHWAMAALELALENRTLKGKNDTIPYQEQIEKLMKEVEEAIQNTKEGVK